MTKTGKIACSAVAAMALIALAFFAGKRAHAPAPPPPAAPEKIAIANVGEYSIYNLVAQKNGYFAKQGLDATITEYDSGGTSMAALLGGKADFAVAADFVGVTNFFKRKDLRILAKVSDQDVWQVIVRRDKGISMPGDIKGKKVGVTKGTSSEYYLGRFLTFNDLNLQDVTVVDLTPAQMTDQLTKGEIDAVVMFEPHGYDLKRQLGDAIIEWPAQQDQQTSALAYTTQAFIEAHPDVVDRYMRAIVMAQQDVAAHPADAQKILGDAMGYDQPYLDYIWPKISFILNLNQDMLLAMEDQARWLIRNGLTTETQVPNYLDAIDFAPLSRAAPDAVTITH